MILIWSRDSFASVKGSAGGHNGIKDIIRRLGTEKIYPYPCRVGAKPKDWDLADFVLGHFSDSDRKLVDEGIRDAAEAVELILSEGVDVAMNKYNRKSLRIEVCMEAFCSLCRVLQSLKK